MSSDPNIVQNPISIISYASLSNEALQEALILGGSNERIFIEVLQRFQPGVYYHCRHLLVSHDDADDATQNTMVKVWQNIHEFKGNSKLRTWIYRIATNESINLIRKRKPTIDFDEAQPEMADLITEDLYLSADEISQKLQKALCFLPFKQKLVFVLKYFEDLTYDEIAELTSTSAGALKASYHHAVKKLEIYLNVLR